MKLLNGLELAGFIKERQAKQVRSLVVNSKITPKLAIIQTKPDPVIDTYVRLKKKYGVDIGVEVEHLLIEQVDTSEVIKRLNNDKNIHGIILQLPISDPTQTDELCNQVLPSKDVDALGVGSTMQPATPMAILWLLAGYNVDLVGKQILLIGRGKLVGQPLEKILKSSGYNVEVADRATQNLAECTTRADVIITATGSPAILYPDMVKSEAVIVDAGVASEDGKTVGDVHSSMYELPDITITPQKGGVGPLTVCALFENVINAAKTNA